jgi:superkiller protein 3
MPYSNLALTYLTQGQYAEAILLYQRSIELLESDKDRALSWNGLGNAFRCINDYANAVAAYQKAAELDPETAGMREGTGTVQSVQNPRNAKAWDDLGELFLKMGSLDKAVEAFQKAIELEPGTGRSYCNLAFAYVSQCNYQDAVPLYLKSIELLEDDKEKAAAWNRLGNVYRKLNDYDNAIKAYQKAVVLADEGVDLLTRTRFSLLSNLTVNQ